jgi:hypothetical protein
MYLKTRQDFNMLRWLMLSGTSRQVTRRINARGSTNPDRNGGRGCESWLR